MRVVVTASVASVAARVARVAILVGTVVVSSVVSSVVGGGCANVSELTVGGTPGSADAATDSSPTAATPDATLTSTLIDRLEAKCALPAGQSDDYTSAAQLSALLQGRWYHCGAIGNWDLPRGTGLSFRFDQIGTYAFLDYADGSEIFTPSTDVNRSGEILYVAFAGTPSDGGTADAGDGGAEAGVGGSMYIPWNDTATRNGFFVSLTRAADSALEFQMLFEQNPRKLHTNELGGTPVLATFVPID